jgi:hypothetical protein
MVAIGLGFFGPAQGTRKKPGTKSGPARTVSGRAWPEARIGLGFFQFSDPRASTSTARKLLGLGLARYGLAWHEKARENRA